MSYVALYRVYRPKDFSDVSGQEVIVKTLKNAVLNNKIGHAYVFSGPRGTGKTSIAKIFAKAINCNNPIDGNPCNTCESCKSVNNNSSVDIIEIDGASNNGVEEIRDLRDKVKYMPSISKYKVYIIDEVHMLTTGAFNALLKTLEEPPAHVIFILATTEVHKIPSTILSRCQRFDFKNIDLVNIEKRIKHVTDKESIEITDEAIKLIALNAKGGMRDALSLLDQAVSYSSNINEQDINDIVGTVSKEDLINLFTNIVNKDVSKSLELVNSFLSSGKEEERLINDLIYLLRDILLVKVNSDSNNNLFSLVESISTHKIYHYLNVLSDMQNSMKYSSQKRIYVELAIMQMIEHEELQKIDLTTSVLELKKELSEIKTKGVKTTTSKTKEDNEPLVYVSDILNVLYEANSSSKEKVEHIIANTNALPNQEMALHLLRDCNVAASSDLGFILTHDNIVLATELMQPLMKDTVLDIFNKEFKDYFVILEKDWLEVRSKYVELLQSGQKRPVISNYDFKIYKKKVKDKRETKIEDESLILAQEFFGKDIVRKKE